jgi:hypothetical protein
MGSELLNGESEATIVEEKRAAISRTEIRDMAMEFAIFQTSVC